MPIAAAVTLLFMALGEGVEPGLRAAAGEADGFEVSEPAEMGCTFLSIITGSSGEAEAVMSAIKS